MVDVDVVATAAVEVDVVSTADVVGDDEVWVEEELKLLLVAADEVVALEEELELLTVVGSRMMVPTGTLNPEEFCAELQQ